MKTVVILGASADREKYGNKSLRAYQQRGYDVYPVNLRETEIEGARVYRSVSERIFQRVILILLLFSGFAMLYGSWRRWG